jgi:hypothetical protein
MIAEKKEKKRKEKKRKEEVRASLSKTVTKRKSIGYWSRASTGGQSQSIF